MIAVAIAVIAGVVAVTCGIVADSNHADTLTFLGVMVKTTAAQIFLAGAICTWALFASLWLLSVGVRRSKDRGIELRARKTLRSRGLPAAGIAAPGIATGPDAGYEADAGTAGTADAADAVDAAGTEPTIELDDAAGFGALDRVRTVIEPDLGRHVESKRYYRSGPSG